jgi:hypothetical protein
MGSDPDGLLAQASVGENGSTAALDSELREGLDIESFVECCTRHDLGGDDSSLSTSAVDPDFNHDGFLALLSFPEACKYLYM